MTLSDRVDSAENYALAKDRADQDVLTAVMNRGAGERTVLQLLEQKRTGSFFMVDIDDFKFFNDTYGHKVGDEVICAVSGQLKKEFRKFDVVFRLGGDEFAVFATDLVDRAACKKHITNIQTALQRVTTANERSFEIKVSIGCTICGSTECTFEKLYKSSDDALYKAKNNGKNCFYIQEIMQ